MEDIHANDFIMREINIRSLIRNYRVKFVNDFDFIGKIKNENSVFLVDEKVYGFYKETIFKKFDIENLILLKASEETKTLAGASRIYKILLEKQVKKNLILLSIGGGVITDVTGFVVSTLYRGIKWIFIPTTLLAQADSCIGGKTSLNFIKYK